MRNRPHWLGQFWTMKAWGLFHNLDVMALLWAGWWTRQPFKVPEFFTWILFQITAFSQGPYPVLGVTCHLRRKCLACPFTTCTRYFKENRPSLLSGKLWLSGIFLYLWGIVLVALDDGPAEVVLAFTVCASSVSWSSEGFFFELCPILAKRYNSLRLSPEYHGRGEAKEKNLLQN